VRRRRGATENSAMEKINSAAQKAPFKSELDNVFHPEQAFEHPQHVAEVPDLTLTGADAGTEPIGNRIVETPINVNDTEFLRNPRSGFVAYVPPGSLKKGESLVTTGEGKVTACTVCHGADLRGLGPVPSLAGRSPSYLARQLYDMQHGNRTGTWTPLMAAVVTNLGPDDLLTASAYLASLEP